MPVDDSRPIWVQLVSAFRTRIASGAWPASSRIPSVRELALAEGVNPNTVQRALGELDREGLTTAERAQGRFVTSDEALIGAVRRELAVGATRDHAAALRGLGLGLDEATALLEGHWNDSHSDSEGGAATGADATARGGAR